MIDLILNDHHIATDQPPGTTVLDFVRYHNNLKGTKIGCREGDCGACTILVGELVEDKVRYRTMTSCLMPLANAAGKHIVTVEGINPADGSLTPVQQAMVDNNGTQCGFCTVGFVMSLTGFCIDRPHVSQDTSPSTDAAVSAIDGNICRCTGYRSIERAAVALSEMIADGRTDFAPAYFAGIKDCLTTLATERPAETSAHAGNVSFVGGGTDVYVQKPEHMAETSAKPLLYDNELRGIRDVGESIEIGASVTVTDLLESNLMQSIFPDLYAHLKLVSSTPIRNMATLAGNFINASPIGDMTVWFLALDAEIGLGTHSMGDVPQRVMPLREFYLGYKQLAKTDDEYIATIRFKKPSGDFRFNFEKVCKRTYLDIATVNTAISLTVRALPGQTWLPPVLSEPPASAGGQSLATRQDVDYTIVNAHVSAGGVGPIPLYLKETSAFLRGKPVNEETITAASELMQSEVSPISDVRGTNQYKRLLLRQLFRAHFVELF